MTTTVKVEAHCGTDEEVHVTLKENDGTTKTTVLQDGESFSDYVYDSREITVKELKSENPA